MDKKPLYMDVAAKIALYIRENKLQPGDKLPTYRVFADLFGVSTRTVGYAMERLNYKRVIDIFPQSGIFLANDAWERLHPSRFNWNNYLNRTNKLPITRIKRFAEMRSSSGYSKLMLSNITLSTEFGWHKLWLDASQKALTNLSPENIFAPSNAEKNEYKLALVEHMAGYGLDTAAENIVLSSDMYSSLRVITHIFFRPGSICYYVSPSIMDISSLYYDMAGFERVPIPADSEGIDIDYFVSKIKKGASAFMVVMPELSLSGVTMSMRRRKELYHACAKNGIAIIELDSFRDFKSGSLPPIKALDTAGLVFYVNSFHNTVNACRSGWIVAAPELVERLQCISVSMGLSEDMFYHRATYEMLTDGSYADYIKGVRLSLVKRERIFYGLLEKYLGDIATWNNESNVFFWIKFRNDIDTFKIVYNSEGFTAINFKQFAFAETNSVLVCILGLKESEMETAIKQLSYLARRSVV